MIYKNKHKVETQKYVININLQRKSTSNKMKHHSNLLVSVILLFSNEHYKKRKQKQTKIDRK